MLKVSERVRKIYVRRGIPHVCHGGRLWAPKSSGDCAALTARITSMKQARVLGPFDAESGDENDVTVILTDPTRPAGDQVGALWYLCTELEGPAPKQPKAPKAKPAKKRQQLRKVNDGPDPYWDSIPAERTVHGDNRVYFLWADDPGRPSDSEVKPVVYYGCNRHYWGAVKVLTKAHGAKACAHEAAVQAHKALIDRAIVQPAPDEWMELVHVS